MSAILTEILTILSGLLGVGGLTFSSIIYQKNKLSTLKLKKKIKHDDDEIEKLKQEVSFYKAEIDKIHKTTNKAKSLLTKIDNKLDILSDIVIKSANKKKPKRKQTKK